MLVEKQELINQQTTSQINLTPAKQSDHDLLLELMEEYYSFDHLPFEKDKADSALRQLLNDDSLGAAWLTQVGSNTAGYIVLALGYSLEYHGRDAFIDELYIREEFRGQGLAFVEKEAQRLGVRALHLEVEQGNTSAQGFYRKAGYSDHDRYLMTKRLDEQNA